MWTTEETCNLIEGYRNSRCLWDPKHSDYKNRIKKHDALEELSKMLNVSVAEVDRKLNNINSQYRRERRNYKKFKKSGAGQYFHPKWFGYNLMYFLQDKNRPNAGRDAGLEDSQVSIYCVLCIYSVLFIITMYLHIGIDKKFNNNFVAKELGLDQR